MSPRALRVLSRRFPSVFLCPRSFGCARLAAGGACAAVGAVLRGQVRSALAVLRPPGHHARRGSAGGFCLFNNAAVAARHGQSLAGSALRVLILDWDIHHGNGTQEIFEEDPSVLYVSLHRGDGSFFPGGPGGSPRRRGRGPGRGFTVNVAWGGPRVGDPEYLTALSRLLLPLAAQFGPELVLVSAGFDAGRGDPLGGCLVSPQTFGLMTHLLGGLAGGRLVLLLEGGYNLSVTAEGVGQCLGVLLGDPPSLPPPGTPQPAALRALGRTLRAQRGCWSCLRLPPGETPPQTDPGPPGPPNTAPGPPNTDLGGRTWGRIWGVGFWGGGFGVGDLGGGIWGEDLEWGILQGRVWVGGFGGRIWGGSFWGGGFRGRVWGGGFGAEDLGGGFRGRIWGGGFGVGDLGEDLGGGVWGVGFWGGGFGVGDLGWGIWGRVWDGGFGGRIWGQGLRWGFLGWGILGWGFLGWGFWGGVWGGILGPPSTHAAVPPRRQGALFAVTPLQGCPHLGAVAPPPPGGALGELLPPPCGVCGSRRENWLCLTCHQVLCGRYSGGHMLAHGGAQGHPLVLSLRDLTAWCYTCGGYVTHPVGLGVSLWGSGGPLPHPAPPPHPSPLS
uniref:UBP-type domain-containing protein n=1 Tax=Taeniopygia guttata TaxID=59729 RepID=A0A674HVW5_TAEGU